MIINKLVNGNVKNNELEKIKINYDVIDYVEYDIPIPEKPTSGLVLLVGSSGSGKSTILKNWFNLVDIKMNNNISTIENFSTLKKGEELLKAFGLRSIPTWFRPPNTLSNGEFHRFYCAKCIDTGIEYIDEFTSVVDRDTAVSLSNSVRKWFKGGLLVIASCHRDIEEWLLPDVIYDTDRQCFVEKRFLRRPKVELRIVSSTIKDWILFKKHHYLTGDVSNSCHFYTAYIGQKAVGFLAIMHRTNRDIKSYWGESRLVVLPEFQGLGIGVVLSEGIAEEYISRGLRYFSKTSHPVLGEYRNKSPKWRATSTNGIKRLSYLKKDGTARMQKGFGKSEKTILRDALRTCFSHEYIGDKS